MISTVQYVENQLPTQALVSLWRGAGVTPGLPRWLLVTNPDGTPHWRFTALTRQAFALSAGDNLSASEAIFDEAGRPTDYMVSKWQAWTS